MVTSVYHPSMQRSIFSNIEALANGGNSQLQQTITTPGNSVPGHQFSQSAMLQQYAAMFGLNSGNSAQDYYAQMQQFMDPRNLWMMNPNYHNLMQQYQYQTNLQGHPTGPATKVHEKVERKSEDLDFVVSKILPKGKRSIWQNSPLLSGSVKSACWEIPMRRHTHRFQVKPVFTSA